MALVSDVMNRTVVAVAPDESIERAEAIAHRTGADHLLVFDQETLVGILCACDLDEPERGDQVSDRMSLPVLTVRPDASVERAAETLCDCDLGCLPVALGGLILGTLGNAELARAGLWAGHAHGRCRHRRRGHAEH